MVTPAVKREAVVHLVVHREVVSLRRRRTCKVLEAARSVVRYHQRRADDAVLRTRLRELAHERKRFGYCRLLQMLMREGVEINFEKRRRLYTEERLQVRKRGGRKRALGTRSPMNILKGPNQRWSFDFVSDMFCHRRLRILPVVDDFTRELNAAIATRKRPAMIVSDNGTEFTSMAILRWSQETAADWHYIAPEKPQQNAFIRRPEAVCFQPREGKILMASCVMSF